MTTNSTDLRGVRIAAVALLVLSVAATGCGRPPDEAWLRFLGFNKSGTDTSSIAVLEGDLNDGKNTSADAVFMNTSVTVGATEGGTGTGILVTGVRIDYRMSGYSPPSVSYPLNLYLPAASVTKGTVKSNEATATGIPVAPASLKHWLNANGVRSAVVDLSAQATFSAVTDEGGKLETHGSIGIVLTNTGSTSTGTETTATVGNKMTINLASGSLYVLGSSSSATLKTIP